MSAAKGQATHPERRQLQRVPATGFCRARVVHRAVLLHAQLLCPHKFCCIEAIPSGLTVISNAGMARSCPVLLNPNQ